MLVIGVFSLGYGDAVSLRVLSSDGDGGCWRVMCGPGNCTTSPANEQSTDRPGGVKEIEAIYERGNEGRENGWQTRNCAIRRRWWVVLVVVMEGGGSFVDQIRWWGDEIDAVKYLYASASWDGEIILLFDQLINS